MVMIKAAGQHPEGFIAGLVMGMSFVLFLFADQDLLFLPAIVRVLMRESFLQSADQVSGLIIAVVISGAISTDFSGLQHQAARVQQVKDLEAGKEIELTPILNQKWK